MMKKILILLLSIFSIEVYAQNQGVTNNWILGYGSNAGPPNGHSKVDFISGFPVISSDSLEMSLFRTAANISNNSGNLMFYTNGYYIADVSHDTMMNGSNISPTGFQNIVPYGLTVPQACLILPYPDSAHLYWLFHSTLDNAPFYNRGHYLYTSLIDMNLNGGLGGVINKNNVIMQDTLNPGKITACKHANGRDWWVICQRVNSNTYFKFLVTSSGIIGPFTQSIGSTRTWSLGQAGFSPGGTKYASFHAEYSSVGGLDIFDFDRCTGMLSNNLHIIIPQSTGFSGGMAFSPNSRFLYTANIDSVYQFDMNAANIATSKFTVAVWDGFYSPSPPFATLFEMMQVAPDGKIYISTGNSTFHMHVINYPDSAGFACDIVQHDLQFQYFYENALPNHPNYFLGCDTTSSCQCLTTDALELTDFINVKSYPNPTSGPVTFQYPVQSKEGEVAVYDVNGKLIMKEYIAPWTQFKRLDFSNMKSGIYLVKLQWDGSLGSVKIIKE